MNIKKIKEIINYKHKDINVIVEIDYKNNEISLMDWKDGGVYYPKKWLYARRGVEFMNNWLDILEAQQEAIKQAKAMYEQELAKVNRFKEEFLIKKIKDVE